MRWILMPPTRQYRRACLRAPHMHPPVSVARACLHPTNQIASCAIPSVSCVGDLCCSSHCAPAHKHRSRSDKYDDEDEISL